MGSIWLDGRTPGYPNVVGVLRAAGCAVAEFDGWQTRSRSSGGMTDFRIVVVHHTASQTTPANDLHYMVYGNPDAPVSNGLLDRTGLFTIISGGASNHAGKGGPWQASRGTVSADNANANSFGIEAANNGVGEIWPQAQQEAYTRMVNALCSAYGLRISSDVPAHREWAPGRKIDPAGQSRWASGSAMWDMQAFRADTQAGWPNGTQPPTPQEIDPMIYVCAPDGGWWPNGYTPATFCMFESGKVRRAINSDMAYANAKQVPTFAMTSAEQYEDMRQLSGTTYPGIPTK